MQTFPFWGHTIEITDSMMRTGEIEREIEKARASTAKQAAPRYGREPRRERKHFAGPLHRDGRGCACR